MLVRFTLALSLLGLAGCISITAGIQDESRQAFVEHEQTRIRFPSQFLGLAHNLTKRGDNPYIQNSFSISYGRGGPALLVMILPVEPGDGNSASGYVAARARLLASQYPQAKTVARYEHQYRCWGSQLTYVGADVSYPEGTRQILATRYLNHLILIQHLGVNLREDHAARLTRILTGLEWECRSAA